LLADGECVMRRASVIKFVSCLLLTCSASLIGPGKVINASNGILQTVTVSVSPSSVTVPVNQTFTISVTVTGVSDLYGWEFQLGWNSTLLNALNVSEGPFLKAGGSTFFTYEVDASAGNMIIDCTLTAPSATHGVSGDGTVGTVTFYATNVGQCSLDLHDVNLADSSDRPIPCQAVGGYGYFTSSQLHDVAVTQVTASPTAALPGDTVNINVTAQNEGNSAELFNVTLYANSQLIGVQPVSLGSNSQTIITFAWNTTGFGRGSYTISASASVVPEEVNTTNNNMQAANPVTLVYNGHDIAIVEVEPLKTVVGQGYSVNITVTAENYGIFSETFNTTIYAGTTALHTQAVNLGSGASTTLTFVWNTSGFVYGNYTISAQASPVSGETDVTNNNLKGGWVIISLIGDITGPNGWPDGKVDMRDVAYVAKRFGTDPSKPLWDPNADINGDGKIEMKDVGTVAKHFGEHYP
jgi:hypothetical protein